MSARKKQKKGGWSKDEVLSPTTHAAFLKYDSKKYGGCAVASFVTPTGDPTTGAVGVAGTRRQQGMGTRGCCGGVNYIDLLDGSDGSDGSVTVEQVQTRTMSPIMEGTKMADSSDDELLYQTKDKEKKPKKVIKDSSDEEEEEDEASRLKDSPEYMVSDSSPST
jgi:hypothetical protein